MLSAIPLYQMTSLAAEGGDSICRPSDAARRQDLLHRRHEYIGKLLLRIGHVAKTAAVGCTYLYTYQYYGRDCIDRYYCGPCNDYPY